ncbi:MAG: RNA-binding domain-containing protein [Sphaerochaetaceae bacterium]
MTLEQIRRVLSLGENQSVEFFASIKNLDILGKTVCGFLNSLKGGYLICGVSVRGEVLGVSVSQTEINELEQELLKNISPKAFIAVQAENIDLKQVVSIEIPSGSDGPYTFKDVIYIRDGTSTQVADVQRIRDMVMRHQIEPERWERRYSLADIEDDVDDQEVKAAVTDAGSVRRVLFRNDENIAMVLEDFSVARYGRLTNGGDVLFAANPAVRLPQTRIRAISYASDKTDDTFLDMKSFEGPLHRVFEDAYTFIVRNTATVSTFTKDTPKRLDAPLYPEEAVREALINAVAHRDYSSASGGVGIHVYPQRLEIWNSGALPEGVTEQSLLVGQISILRNPDIAHVLYLRGLMEKAGRGSVLMVKKCLESGLPSPFWKSDPKLGVTVTFLTTEATTEVVRLLHYLKGEMSRAELQTAMGLENAEHFRKSYIKPALALKAIERTEPHKRTSPDQKYRMTSIGKRMVAKSSGMNEPR